MTRTRTHRLLGRLIGVAVALHSVPTWAAREPALETEDARLSYGVGVGIARSFDRQGVHLDAGLVAKGLEDALSGRALRLSEEELREAASRLQGMLQARQARRARRPAEASREEEAFLADHARREGVFTLPSGVQYEVLRAGEGPRPAPTDTVVCQYRGTFVDGAEFDSSYRRGRPATFQLAKVIPGWREALELMPVGSRWRVVVPSRLGYGTRGLRGRSRGPAKIGANATLIFEVELLGIPSRAAAPSAPPAAREG